MGRRRRVMEAKTISRRGRVEQFYSILVTLSKGRRNISGLAQGCNLNCSDALPRYLEVLVAKGFVVLEGKEYSLSSAGFGLLKRFQLLFSDLSVVGCARSMEAS